MSNEYDRYRSFGTEGYGQRPIEGLGGWLILPMIGLVFAPFITAYSLWESLPDFQYVRVLEPLKASYVVGVTAVQMALYIPIPMYLLLMMARRQARFPRAYQLFLVIGLVLVLADLLLAFFVFREEIAAGAVVLFDGETVQALVGAVVGAAIWIPYMSESVRVKNTFVN